jgi:hypothetical protein
MDDDRDQDVVLCGNTDGLYRISGIAVFRNVGGRFRNVTAALGIRPIGEMDAVMGQLGGSRHADLVQLSRDRIRISRWSPPRARFVVVHEASVVNGYGVALGDADGDGDNDLYLQRGGGGRNEPDVILLNRGGGTAWSALAVPSTATGNPDGVVVLDHDGDGRSDFLVLNGRMSEGPVQLITVAPAT